MAELDNTILALAKAIKKVETGDGDTYSKTGASGEIGAYQFMPSTWSAYAKKYLGDSNAALTTENQNKIAYYFIKDKKDQGYTPAQIASMWNAGEGEPNAYTGSFSNGSASIGTNSKGVKFNVPDYVKKVSEQYFSIKGLVTSTSNLDKTTASALSTVEEVKELMSQPNIVQSVAQNVSKPVLKVASTVASLFKSVAGLIGYGIDTALGNKAEAQIQLNEAAETVVIDAGYFGKATPIGYDENGNKVSDTEALKQAVGTGIELAAYRIPYGEIETITSSALKTVLLNNANKVISPTVTNVISRAGGILTSSAAGVYTSETGSQLAEGDSVLDAVVPSMSTLNGTLIAGGIIGSGALVKNGVSAIWSKTEDFLSDALPARYAKPFLSKSYYAGGTQQKLTVDDILNSKMGITKDKAIADVERTIEKMNSEMDDFYKQLMSNDTKVSMRQIVSDTVKTERSRATADFDTPNFFEVAGIKTGKDIISMLEKIVPEAKGIFTKRYITSQEAAILKTTLLRKSMNLNESTELTLARKISDSLNAYLTKVNEKIIAEVESTGEITLSDGVKKVLMKDYSKELAKNYALLDVLKNMPKEEAVFTVNDIVTGIIERMLWNYPVLTAVLKLQNIWRFFISPDGNIVMTILTKKVGTAAEKIGEKASDAVSNTVPYVKKATNISAGNLEQE